MAGIRAWLAAAVACALLVPAAASAAAPGDKVAFQIPDSDRGDAYVISVDGRRVADGVDDTDDPGLSGEFEMPDLGDKARQVAVLIEVQRAADGSSRSYESNVDYTPAESSGAQPASKPAPARPPARAPVPAPAPRPRPVVIPPPVPVQLSDSGGKIPRTPERILRGLTGAAPLRRRGAHAHSVGGTRHHAHRRHHKTKRFHAGSEPAPPTVRSLAAPRDTRVDLSDGSFPGVGYSVAWKLLAGVVAAALLLALMVAARSRLVTRPG